MTHQLVRHRLVAYTQKSQRYVEEEGMWVVTPPSIAPNKDGDLERNKVFMEAMFNAQQSYNVLRKLGVPKEDARFVLPNATQTEIVVSANFRQWRHMIKLRTSKHAQWEIRAVFNQVLDILYEWCPSVFDDLKRSRDEESN
jgi:thymidylate synthase (FAD)